MSDPVVYGIHAVEALLKNTLRMTRQIYVNTESQNPRIDSILKQATLLSLPIAPLSSKKMQERFPLIAHQGIVAIAESMPFFREGDLLHLLESKPKPWLILILDTITDPHNLGACLRSADAAGVDCVVIPKDKSATVTPVVSKVACGAAESVSLVSVTNLVRSMEILKKLGVWIYGADAAASTSLYEIDLKASIAFVMGAEDRGLRRLTRETCDDLFALPMQGSVSSLNVSVATGICLFEAGRQRLGPK